MPSWGPRRAVKCPAVAPWVSGASGRLWRLVGDMSLGTGDGAMILGGTLLSQIHWGASRIIAAAGGFGRGAEAVAWDVDHCLPALGPGESSGLICRSPVPSQRPAVPRGYAWRLESHGPDLLPSCRLLAL